MNCLYVRLKKIANIFFITNGMPGISLNMVNKNTDFSRKIGILLDLIKIFFKWSLKRLAILNVNIDPNINENIDKIIPK